MRVLDIGAGSGCIGITLALEAGVQSVATDLSAPALAIAARNNTTLRGGVQFLQADLASPFAPASFDAVISNPPYIPEHDRHSLATEVRDHEPAPALFAGPDGLDIYRRLIPQAAHILRPGGLLALEFGFGQAQAIERLLDGWSHVSIHPDLAGIPRVALARKPDRRT